MRVRAGIVLIQDGKVALIERHRAGIDYFVFPGGGMDQGETPEQAAVREAMEELGIEVAIKQKIAEIQMGQKSRQMYFLVEQIGGTFGTGTGEEYTDADPHDPDEGVYIPIWMPIDQLSAYQNIYPVQIAQQVILSATAGWAEDVMLVFDEPK